MGFLDKVKEQAATAQAVAKDAAQKGQAKLDEVQAKRAADGLLRDLGLAAYAEQTGRGSEATQAAGQRVLAALGSHEAEHGALPIVFESDAANGAGGAGAGSSGGSYPSPPGS